MAGFEREVNRDGDTLADLLVENIALIAIELQHLNNNLCNLLKILKKGGRRNLNPLYQGVALLN